MAKTTTARQINAPIEVVFDTIAHIENFSKAVPAIVSTEFVTEQTRGSGTRFLETREFRGKKMTHELKVGIYEPNSRVQMISEAGGVIWDSMFTVEERDGGTLMTLGMEARPQKFLARIMVPLMLKMCSSAVEGDMDSLKTYCEGLGSNE